MMDKIIRRGGARPQLAGPDGRRARPGRGRGRRRAGRWPPGAPRVRLDRLPGGLHHHRRHRASVGARTAAAAGAGPDRRNPRRSPPGPGLDTGTAAVVGSAQGPGSPGQGRGQLWPSTSASPPPQWSRPDPGRHALRLARRPPTCSASPTQPAAWTKKAPVPLQGTAPGANFQAIPGRTISLACKSDRRLRRRRSGWPGPWSNHRSWV